jgi:hypothetical protein
VVGLDIAKSVFQVHGVDRDGAVVVRRRLRRFHTWLQAVLTAAAVKSPLHDLNWTCCPRVRAVG